MKRIIVRSLTAVLLLAAANLFANEKGPQSVFNVLDYGAKGDGTNDDTTAIQLVNGPTLRNMQVVWTEK